MVNLSMAIDFSFHSQRWVDGPKALDVFHMIYVTEIATASASQIQRRKKIRGRHKQLSLAFARFQKGVVKKIARARLS